MRKLNNLQDLNINKVFWDEQTQLYWSYPQISFDLNQNDLIFIANIQSGVWFGSIHNGEIFISDINLTGADKLIHELIDEGLTPYQALEILEL